MAVCNRKSSLPKCPTDKSTRGCRIYSKTNRDKGDSMERLTQGYCIVTETISGPELLWRVTTQGSGSPAEVTYPEIFETEKEAQKELVRDQMEYLQQFLDSEREFDEIPGDNDFIAYITIDSKGYLVVSDNTDTPIIITTLEKWKGQL